VNRAPSGRPARVLMLTKGLGRGGTERLLAGAVRHLDRGRFHVEVAYLLPWKDAFVAEVEAAAVPVHCLDAPRATSLGWVGRLRRLVREHEIDLVHTHMPVPAAIARLALPGRHPAFVHTEHNLWGRYRPPTRLANRATYRRNAAVIAVSDGVAGSIRSQVPVEVVAHGIDTGRLRPADDERRDAARRALGIDAEAPVVGTVGNLTAKKDQATLLAASARLAGEHPHLRVVLVGSGPLEHELRTRALRLGLGDAVVFAGSRDDVFDLLPAFDLFALSSRFEGLPIALLEAMASGVPPVVTRVGGVPEVVTDGEDGLLVEPGDPDGLATCLGKLLADPGRRAELGARAVERAAAFDLAHAVRRIEAIYDRALAWPAARSSAGATGADAVSGALQR
jgi:glycosyltransferase involved in cell wall biosynthesis